MTVTATSLKAAAAPAFDDAADALVELKIDDAELMCAEGVYGDQYDLAVRLLATHNLAMLPDGRPMRLDPEGKAGLEGFQATTWGQRYQQLKVAKACGRGRVT